MPYLLCCFLLTGFIPSLSIDDDSPCDYCGRHVRLRRLSKGNTSIEKSKSKKVKEDPECLNSDTCLLDDYSEQIALEALLLNDELEQELAEFPFELYADLFGESAPGIKSDDSQESIIPSLPFYELKAPFSGQEQLGVEVSAANQNGTEFAVRFDNILAQFTSFNVTYYALQTAVTREGYSESNILSIVQSSSFFMIRDLLFFEGVVRFDAENVVFPYYSSEEGDARFRILQEKDVVTWAYYRPHPCTAKLEVASLQVQRCSQENKWPSFDRVCVKNADKDFDLAMAAEKKRYLNAIGDANRDFRQQDLVQQVVYNQLMVESLAQCKRLQSLFRPCPEEREYFSDCFSKAFRRSVDNMFVQSSPTAIIKSHGYPLVPLIRDLLEYQKSYTYPYSPSS
jgi:hypothetical protein